MLHLVDGLLTNFLARENSDPLLPGSLARVDYDSFGYLISRFCLFVAFEMDVVEVLVNGCVDAPIAIYLLRFTRLDQLEVIVKIYGA